MASQLQDQGLAPPICLHLTQHFTLYHYFNFKEKPTCRSTCPSSAIFPVPIIKTLDPCPPSLLTSPTCLIIFRGQFTLICSVLPLFFPLKFDQACNNIDVDDDDDDYYNNSQVIMAH